MAKAKAKVKMPTAKTGQLGPDIPSANLGMMGEAIPSATKLTPGPVPKTLSYKPDPLLSANLPSDFDSIADVTAMQEMDLAKKAQMMPDKPMMKKKAAVKKKSGGLAPKKKSAKVSTKKKPNMQEMVDEIDAGRGSQYIKG